MSYFSHGFKVGHVGIRIAKGFSIYHLGVGLDGCFEGFKVVDVDNGVGDALCCQCVGDEVERTAIKIVGCYDVVACTNDVLQCIGDGCCTTGYCQACYTAFERCNAVFKHALCGVGQTTIDITCIAQTEAVGSVLRVTKYVRSGLIDRYGTGVGCGIGLFLAYMYLKSLEMIVFVVAHSLFVFYCFYCYFLLQR